jgi:Recombinase
LQLKTILRQVPDPRGKQGQDYMLWSILSLIVVSLLWWAARNEGGLSSWAEPEPASKGGTRLYTRCKRRGRWEHSTVWGMLRNPAYKGQACFGKTTMAPRQRITRPIRLRGGIAPRNSASHERSREDWIPIAVPPIVSVFYDRLMRLRAGSADRRAARRAQGDNAPTGSRGGAAPAAPRPMLRSGANQQ